LISGGIRSHLGRRCRDTFASPKKTCRKLGISFWEYLNDRIEQTGTIPPLPDIVRERAAAAAVLKLPAQWLLRLRHNPFYNYQGQRMLDWIDDANAQR
jgi:hypothetical protein